MNCREFQLELEKAIEGRAVLGTAARSHGCVCTEASCQAAWNDYVFLNQVLSEFRSMTPQVDFTSQVISQLQDQSVAKGKAQESRQAFGRGAVASICGVAILLGLCVLTPSFSVFTPSSCKSVDNLQPVQNVQVAVILAPQLVTAHYIDWVEGASSRVGESLVSVGAGTREPPVDAPASDESLWMDVWGQHLKSLEDELGKAVETLTGQSDDDLT